MGLQMTFKWSTKLVGQWIFYLWFSWLWIPFV